MLEPILLQPTDQACPRCEETLRVVSTDGVCCARCGWVVVEPGEQKTTAELIAAMPKAA